MKKTQSFFLAALLVLLSIQGFSQKQRFSFNEIYEVSDSPELRISSNDGNVEVYPSDKNEIEVFYIVERNRQLLDVTRRDLEEDYTIEVSSGREFLEILVKPKYQYRFIGWQDRIKVSFEVYTPFKTSCNLNCSDGNIRITGLTADQKMHSSDGDIQATKIKGDVNARTSDGDLFFSQIIGDVEPITSDGNIELINIQGSVSGRTSDGDADLEDIKGIVTLVTSDGDLNAENVNGDVKLTSSDGDIWLTQSQGDMTLTTSDGGISFRDISGSMKARTSDGQIKGNMLRLESSLELRTSDGDIYVTIPDKLGLDILLRGEVIRTELDNFSGTSKDHLVEGQINGGGLEVNLHASDGRVSLSYAD